MRWRYDIWSIMIVFCRNARRFKLGSHSCAGYHSLPCTLGLTVVILVLRINRLFCLPTYIILLQKWSTTSRGHHYFGGGSCINVIYRTIYWKGRNSFIAGESSMWIVEEVFSKIEELLVKVVWGLDCELFRKRESSILEGVWKLILNFVLRIFSAEE